MANATDIVKKGVVRRTDEFIKRSAKTLSSPTRFYTHAMIGLGTDGYLAKFDDTASMLFAGIVRGNEGNPLLPVGTAGDDALGLDIQMPYRFELAIASVAVTDIGKTVYAVDDQTGTLDPATRTYANVVGVVADVVASGIALVEPAYDGVAGNKRLMAARRMAATGGQTISRWDMGKTILVANTAALALTLPAIATIPPGQSITFVKDHASDTNAITLTGNGSENIDGSNTLGTLDAPWDVATLVSNGTRWVVTSRDIA